MKSLSIGKHISSIYRHQSIIINNLLSNYEFGSGQYLFLIKISQNEGITQKELSKEINIDRANTNRAVFKLEKLGYIKTLAEEKKKRNRNYYITTKGKSIIEDFVPKLSYVTDVLTRGMSDEEKNTLFNLICKVEDNVKTEVAKIRNEVVDEE